ncbi:MAG: EAL domain-containing protein [Gammaproteobacteria bacterium]|nr:EAL domain-containing protein [Gammaproteobacteria bacterium]
MTLLNGDKYIELIYRLLPECMGICLIAPAGEWCDARVTGLQISDMLQRVDARFARDARDRRNGVEALDGAHTLHYGCVQDQTDTLIVTVGIATAAQADAANVDALMTFVGGFIRDEYRLNRDMLNITDELATRYEELNLVYDTEDELSSFSEQDDVLQKLVENCVDYLDVNLAALLVPGKGIHKSHYSKALAPQRIPLLLKELSASVFDALRTSRQGIVANNSDDANRLNVSVFPGKLLCTPIFVVNEVDGMLAVVTGVSHKDFTNSDRNILEVLARKASKVIQTNYDARTGLVKRVGLEYHLENALQSARHTDCAFTVLQADVDRLQLVNDLDHQAGDVLIQRVARLIEKQVRASDTVASLGGGCFGVLLRDCSLTEGERVGEKIRAAVEGLAFEWNNHPLDVSASVGIAQLTSQTESIDEVMTGIEMATKEAKEKGRNRVHLFDDPELVQRRDQITWVSRIQDALREDRFELYAQPIAPIDDAREIRHWEILLRMQDNQGQIVPPGLFLPSAERYQLMPGIDRWVLRRTLELLTDHGMNELEFHAIWAINLSGYSVSDGDFLRHVKEEIRRTGTKASSLCFEVTETSAVANLAEAQRFIGALQELGCAFSLDDFGTGFSSLKYLRELTVDYLKIDGSFVSNVHQDPVNSAMVKAIHQVGRVVGTKTVAEFVENDEILEHLRGIGIDYAQGYGIGRPGPLLDVLQVLGKRHSKRYA